MKNFDKKRYIIIITVLCIIGIFICYKTQIIFKGMNKIKGYCREKISYMYKNKIDDGLKSELDSYDSFEYRTR